MTNNKQNNANRQNAKLSTGPVTDAGKAIVSKNALKHGIFAQESIINKGDGKENKDDYDSLIIELNEDLKPQGKLEQLLVEKIAVNFWRMKRLIRYETGQIKNIIDDFKKEILNKYYSSENKNIAMCYGIFIPDEPPMEYLFSSNKISKLDIKNQEKRIKMLDQEEYDYNQEDEFIKYVLEKYLTIEKDEINEEHRKQVTEYLSNLSPKSLGNLKSEYRYSENKILIAMKEAYHWLKQFEIIERIRNIPEKMEIEKIVKYENSLEKSIFRNLAALRELQRNRQG